MIKLDKDPVWQEGQQFLIRVLFNKALSLCAAERHVTAAQHSMPSLSALTMEYKSSLGRIITKIILSIMMLVSQEG